MVPEYAFDREKYVLLHVEHIFCNSLSEVSPPNLHRPLLFCRFVHRPPACKNIFSSLHSGFILRVFSTYLSLSLNKCPSSLQSTDLPSTEHFQEENTCFCTSRSRDWWQNRRVCFRFLPEKDTGEAVDPSFPFLNSLQTVGSLIWIVLHGFGFFLCVCIFFSCLCGRVLKPLLRKWGTESGSGYLCTQNWGIAPPLRPPGMCPVLSSTTPELPGRPPLSKPASHQEKVLCWHPKWNADSCIHFSTQTTFSPTFLFPIHTSSVPYLTHYLSSIHSPV